VVVRLARDEEDLSFLERVGIQALPRVGDDGNGIGSLKRDPSLVLDPFVQKTHPGILRLMKAVGIVQLWKTLVPEDRQLLPPTGLPQVVQAGLVDEGVHYDDQRCLSYQIPKGLPSPWPGSFLLQRGGRELAQEGANLVEHHDIVTLLRWGPGGIGGGGGGWGKLPQAFQLNRQALLKLDLEEEALGVCQKGLKVDPREPIMLIRSRDIGASIATKSHDYNASGARTITTNLFPNEPPTPSSLMDHMKKLNALKPDPRDVEITHSHRRMQEGIENSVIVHKAHQCRDGIGRSRDMRQAASLYEQAAKKGSAEGELPLRFSF
jgi:hypothetical protein